MAAPPVILQVLLLSSPYSLQRSVCAAPLAAAAGGCRGLKGRPAPALRPVCGCSPRCQQGLTCRQGVETRSLWQSSACRRGPLFVGCVMVWPSCQEALDAPRLVCSPPVWPLLLNVHSHLMNRMWPQWSHPSPLRLGADSLWLPSGASRVLTPREASGHIDLLYGATPWQGQREPSADTQ